MSDHDAGTITVAAVIYIGMIWLALCVTVAAWLLTLDD